MFGYMFKVIVVSYCYNSMHLCCTCFTFYVYLVYLFNERKEEKVEILGDVSRLWCS